MTIKIGPNLKELLEKNNLSLRELSKRTGVPSSTLQEWTINRSPKNPLQVQKVAKELGVSLHYLLFGEEDSLEPLSLITKQDNFSGTFEITIKRVAK